MEKRIFGERVAQDFPAVAAVASPGFVGTLPGQHHGHVSASALGQVPHRQHRNGPQGLLHGRNAMFEGLPQVARRDCDRMVFKPQHSGRFGRVCQLTRIVASTVADAVARQLSHPFRCERCHERGIDPAGEKDSKGHVRKQLPLDRAR